METNDKFLILKGSVGNRGDNYEEDVRNLTNFLSAMGYGDVIDDNDLETAIRVFQHIINPRRNSFNPRQESARIQPYDDTHLWLCSKNLPKWMNLNDLDLPGIFNDNSNHRNPDREEEHNGYGTSWLKDFFEEAGKYHNTNYVANGSRKIAINDCSPRVAGRDNPDHQEHELGIEADIKLPRIEGDAQAYGNTAWCENRALNAAGTNWVCNNRNDTVSNGEEYSQSETEAILRSFHSTGKVNLSLFNDHELRATRLIDGDNTSPTLCSYQNNHDDHIHVRISRPERKSILFNDEIDMLSLASLFIFPLTKHVEEFIANIKEISSIYGVNPAIVLAIICTGTDDKIKYNLDILLNLDDTSKPILKKNGTFDTVYLESYFGMEFIEGIEELVDATSLAAEEIEFSEGIKKVSVNLILSHYFLISEEFHLEVKTSILDYYRIFTKTEGFSLN